MLQVRDLSSLEASRIGLESLVGCLAWPLYCCMGFLVIVDALARVWDVLKSPCF